MRVLLDNRRCDVAGETIGEAIAAGEAIARQQGRRVIEVCVDGEVWADDRLTMEAMLSGRAGEVRLLSVEPASLAREALLEARDTLSTIDALQQEAATLIEQGRSADAMRSLGEAISLWRQVRDAALDGSRFARIDLGDVRTADQSMAQGVARLNEHLTRLASALRSRDIVLLTDTLLYEMPPVIALWRELLEAAAACASKPNTERRATGFEL